MEYLINKKDTEKISDLIKFHWKADNDIILYYHYLSVKDELKKELRNHAKKYQEIHSKA
jgi:hypothetical protein